MHNIHRANSYCCTLLYVLLIIVCTYYYDMLINKIYSKECQVQHWKEHKQTCTFIKERYDEWKDARNNLPEGTQLDTKEGPCAICLEEIITNPVVLPCGHVFCFKCVGQYQVSSKSNKSVHIAGGRFP